MAYGARPVPQNIMSVEFKLFDFMTVKQFMISFGLLIFCFLLFFLLPMPWKVFVPLFIFVVGGIIIFVPFNGAPFHEFLSSYIEAMISPQRRVWNKKGVIVKTAYLAAKKQEKGKAFNEDEENFTYIEDDQHRPLTEDQITLNDLENQFLSIQNQPKVDIAQYNKPGTSASGTVVNNKVNLDQFADSKTNDIQVDPDDEYAVKNYIFGGVEDKDSKPINGASVTILLNDAILEEVFTNINGEFQSHYEYKAGNYVIAVQYGSKAFNSVNFYHDPIDPAPISIHPVDYKEKTDPITEESAPQTTGLNGEVFEGTYDARHFDVGSEYDKKILEATKPVDVKDLEVKVAEDLKLQEKPEVSSDANKINIQDLKNGNAGLQNEKELLENFQELIKKSNSLLNKEPKVSTDIQVPKYLQNEVKMDNITKSSEVLKSANIDSNDSSILPSQLTAPAATVLSPVKPKVVMVFNNLPNSSSSFEQAFLLIPNTINGEVTDKDNAELSNVTLNVFDSSNNLVRTLISNAEGKFYSFSPLPSGKYTISLKKDNFEFPDFELTLDGNIIYPKTVSTIEKIEKEENTKP